MSVWLSVCAQRPCLYPPVVEIALQANKPGTPSDWESWCMIGKMYFYILIYTPSGEKVSFPMR